MKPVRFAIVGLGYGGTRCAMLRETEGVELCAVVDRDPARAEEFGSRFQVPHFTGHREMLAAVEVDVVAIYTPSGLHLDIALDVINAGKHILMTKPIEVTLARTDMILDAAHAAGVQIFTEFYLRYYRDNLRAKQAILTGRLGRLILGEFSFKCFRPKAYYLADGAWRQTVELNGGGILMNQALHAIDQMTWMMGAPLSVSARVDTLGLDIPVEDTAVATFRMESGALAVLTTTSTFRTTVGMDDIYGGGFSTRAEVSGTSGSFTILENALTMTKLETGQIDEVPAAPVNVFEDVAAALNSSGYTSLALAPGRSGRLVVKIAQAIYESGRTGREIELPSGPGGEVVE